MPFTKGFMITINDKDYLVICDYASASGTKSRDYTFNALLEMQVFEMTTKDCGKMIKLDKRSYVVEKITDYIKNSINGQDACYWDFDKKCTRYQELKALEIIKNKKVNFYWLSLSSCVEDYNKHVKDCFCKPYFEEFLLTEEEFDLLKEVLL